MKYIRAYEHSSASALENKAIKEKECRKEIKDMSLFITRGNE